MKNPYFDIVDYFCLLT